MMELSEEEPNTMGETGEGGDGGDPSRGCDTN